MKRRVVPLWFRAGRDEARILVADCLQGHFVAEAPDAVRQFARAGQCGEQRFGKIESPFESRRAGFLVWNRFSRHIRGC